MLLMVAGVPSLNLFTDVINKNHVGGFEATPVKKTM